MVLHELALLNNMYYSRLKGMIVLFSCEDSAGAFSFLEEQ